MIVEFRVSSGFPLAGPLFSHVNYTKDKKQKFDQVLLENECVIVRAIENCQHFNFNIRPRNGAWTRLKNLRML